MNQLLAIAIGGALGALGRYGVVSLVFPVAAGRFPLGTLAVNVAGSLLMGIFYVLIVEKALLPAELRNLVMVGFLGAFTTFSTFSLDALALWQNGDLALALIYVVASVVLCIAGIALAIYLTRLL